MNPLPAPTSQWRTALRICSGNFLAMYDLMVIGYYATPQKNSDISRE